MEPAERARDLLPTCSVAIITSTTLITEGLDALLEAAAGCREVALLGPSTPLLPEVFADTPVTWLSGIRIENPEKVLRVVSEGGGTRDFSPYVQKVNLRLPGRGEEASTRSGTASADQPVASSGTGRGTRSLAPPGQGGKGHDTEPTCQDDHPPKRTRPANDCPADGSIRHKIMILSGKGGVGKSTVAANLAVFLSAFGWRTGLLDIDLHGPSIPKLLGLEGRLPGASPEGMLPVSLYEKLKVMSIGFLLGEERDQPVIVRGPMKHKLIQQFLADVVWGDLDYLIVDSPPGTGDEPLSIAQLVHGADGAVIVTTPQEMALADVRKCIQFCHQVRLPVIGVVENMSGLTCPHCGRVVAPFKTGGGEAMAQKVGVPFLGRIPWTRRSSRTRTRGPRISCGSRRAKPRGPSAGSWS